MSDGQHPTTELYQHLARYPSPKLTAPHYPAVITSSADHPSSPSHQAHHNQISRRLRTVHHKRASHLPPLTAVPVPLPRLLYLLIRNGLLDPLIHARQSTPTSNLIFTPSTGPTRRRVVHTSHLPSHAHRGRPCLSVHAGDHAGAVSSSSRGPPTAST